MTTLKEYINKIILASPPNTSKIEFELCLDENGVGIIHDSPNKVKFTISREILTTQH